MIHLREQYWAVEVPEGAVNIKLHKPIDDRWHLHWEIPRGNVNNLIVGRCLFYSLFGSKKKYPKTLEIVCTSKEVTEAAGIVDKDNRGYKHYWEDKGFTPRGFNGRYKTAIESFHSLLTSKGCDLKLNWLIFKKI